MGFSIVSGGAVQNQAADRPAVRRARHQDGCSRTPGKPIDVDTIEALEELLIMADVGVAGRRGRIIRGGQTSRQRQAGSLRDAVKDEIAAIFAS
jgi:hypothetical protein